MNYFFSTVWKYWRMFGEFMGNIFGRLVIMVMYVTLVLPFALIAKVAAPEVLDTKRDKSAEWRTRLPYDNSIEAGLLQGHTEVRSS